MLVELIADQEALERTGADEIRELTRRATAATYHSNDLTMEEIEFIQRVVRISPECVTAAATNSHQRLVTATVAGKLAGFVIATVHAEAGRELDWLMVDPTFHGSGISSPLMHSGIVWLGEDQPIWLNVVRHNERAIGFYRKHGFEIDPSADCAHAMPHWIMRRSQAPA